ncbi:MAG: TIGR03905 family TSCPD domain-containing protein [Ruminococcaceae bacterium]|nr:TIGR03905 family TSCPD domain-containing protein [Oscillospiraceae bacterium]
MKEVYLYKNQGTCSSHIKIEVEDTKLVSAEYYGGCAGNTKGVAALVSGMELSEVIDRLGGIRCGFKPTSCPDQLAKALTLIQNGESSPSLKKITQEEA